MTLTDLKTQWADVPEFHKVIHEHFIDLVNADNKLRVHRNFVQDNVFGMGEKSFWWLWKLICEELPENPKLLELGVFKAATMSLWKMLRPDAICYGVTPLDGRGTGWTEDDYAAHIRNIHEKFNLEQPELIIGSSQNEKIITQAWVYHPYDVVYIDGSHEYEDALDDFKNYAPMVKVGGYLVVDDCNNDMNFPPTGFFCGIQSVTDAKTEWLKTQTNFEFICSVVHISVFCRIK